MRQLVRNAESSVTERVVITMQLEDMASAVEHLDTMPIREALDSLDGVIECCKETLTNLENLKVWANQPTEGVNIPF